MADRITINDLKMLCAKRGIKVLSGDEMDNVEAFVDVYHAAYGFKARHMWKNKEDIPGLEFWEPWQTGWMQYQTMADAWMAEGLAMAQELELPVVL